VKRLLREFFGQKCTFTKMLILDQKFCDLPMASNLTDSDGVRNYHMVHMVFSDPISVGLVMTWAVSYVSDISRVTGFGVIKTWTLLLDLFFQILNRLVASFVSQLMPMTHIG